MAYDEGLAQRVRELLEDRADDLEDDMMVRVGAEGHTDALAQPHARPMDFTGKAMKGMVYVGPEGLEGDDNLESWL